LLGIGAVVTLAVLGLFPVAVVAAAALVPLVMVTYLYDVDLYEDEPLRVYALTLAWGTAAGAAMGLFLRATVESDPLGPGPDATFIVLRGVAVPLLSVALMLVGPLVRCPTGASTMCSMVRPSGRPPRWPSWGRRSSPSRSTSSVRVCGRAAIPSSGSRAC